MTSSTRFVLDTNALVSALLLPRSITRRAVDHAFECGQVLASQATLDELADVLRRPKFDRYVVEEERLRFLSTYIQTVQIIEVTIKLTDCRDEKDNKFLELAVSEPRTVLSVATETCSNFSHIRVSLSSRQVISSKHIS